MQFRQVGSVGCVSGGGCRKGRLHGRLTLAALACAAVACGGEEIKGDWGESTSAAGVARGRVRVADGTVVTDRGTLLRGASMMILKNPNYATSPAFWKHVRSLGINAVRLDVKTTMVGKTVAEQIPHLDRAVNLAAVNGMYIMPKTSIKPGGYDLAMLKEFWQVVAPRYKNRTHVFYEVTNEPVSGGPRWGDARQWTDDVISDLLQVYHIMRAGAPKTHITLLSTPNLYPDCAAYKAVLAKWRGVDWSNASVSFHHYGGTEEFGEANLRCLKSSYPLLMTETNYWHDDGASRRVPRTVHRLYERLGISWFSLDGKGSTTHLANEIIPDLQQAGHGWPVY